MNTYTFLSHTADAKFKAFGDTLEEAFRQAALAVSSLMWDWRKVRKTQEVQIKVQGSDGEQLLVNFLEEILYLWDTKMFLLGDVEKVAIEEKEDGYQLAAVFKGDNDGKKYEIHGGVKAITYNEMEIKKKQPVAVQVVVDV